MHGTKMRTIFLLVSKIKQFGFINSIVQRRKICEETNHLKECLQKMKQTLDSVNCENASLRKQMEEAKETATMYFVQFSLFLLKYVLKVHN